MELINKQYALASAISGIVITDENGEKWIRVRDVRESIMNVPIIEAEPVKHGHWIVLHGVLAGDDIYGDMGECSNCGLHLRNWEWNFCPCCGAKMDEVENGI